MLPVVIAAAEHQPVLCPDDLGADGEARGDQAVGHSRCVQRAMPNIGHITWKEGPGLAPVRAVVIQDLARSLGLGRARLVAPRGIVLDAVGRVGHHEEWFDAAQEAPNHIGAGAVTADQPMGSEFPKITCN